MIARDAFIALAAASAAACATPAEQSKAAPMPTPQTTTEAPKPPPTTPDAEFRGAKPPPAPVEPRFAAPVPADLKLASGAALLVVENHSVPLVSIDVLVKAGIDAEPLSRAGLAGFTASMLTEGTTKRSALDFAAAVEDLAARLSATADNETSRVRLNCLKETLPQALDLLAEALTSPAFRSEDIERVRGLLLTGLLQKKGSAPALAADEAARILFGDKHPWGQPSGGTPETIKAVARVDMVKFHETWFRPNNAMISVSGDVTPDEVRKLLDERLKGWKARPLPKLTLPPLPVATKRSVTMVDKPGASQSQIWAVGRLFAASDPDRVPMTVANYVLGGLFGSRLNMNLREDKGYSYGVRSGLTFGRTYGALYAAGGVKAQVSAEALAEYQKEFGAFSTGALREGELDKAREAYVRSLPGALETNDAVASSIASVAFFGLPLDWYRRLPGMVVKVDAAEVARVARKYVQVDRMPIIVVGPLAESEKKIRAMDLGPVEVRVPDAPSVREATPPKT